MAKDYSEYKHTEQEKYSILRRGNSKVYFDFFINKASFSINLNALYIEVDRFNEYISMKESIDEFEELERSLRDVHTDILSDEDIADDERNRVEGLEKNKALRKYFDSKYNIDWNRSDEFFKRLSENYKVEKEKPLENVLSGTRIELNIGEGILDFIYADFKTPFKKVYGFASAFESITNEYMENHKINRSKELPEKIYNCNQENVQMFFRYIESKEFVDEIANSSLYTAICPPVFIKENIPIEGLGWYYNYLITLQEEYKELIEFCFDENFYPEVMKNIYPAERFHMYKHIHNQSGSQHRDEYFSFRRHEMSGSKMPYGMTAKEIGDRIGSEFNLTEQHKEFQERYKLTDAEVEIFCRFPMFVQTSYEFRNVKDILELEFTKLLEHNIRFRKCKRCGKYFIMKGNYDTNYCDRIAEGETKNCQDIMAMENYKKKMADNAAINIYYKYYKRYSARVKAHTILEGDFQKWKYEAMTKRNECMDGKLSEEDFICWMENCFPNRNRKH